MMFLSLLWLQASGQVQASRETTPREKMAYALAANAEMAAIEVELGELVEAAAVQGDDQRQRCLQHKERRVQELHRAAEDATEALPDALASGVPSLAEIEFTKVTVALGRSRQYREEASRCAVDERALAVQAAWGGPLPSEEDGSASASSAPTALEP